MNMNNYAVLSGRLTSDVAIFANKNGSAKVKFSLAIENNYKNADGTVTTQFIPVEAYVKDGSKLGPYALIHKGDKVRVQCELRTNNYVDRAGQQVYSTVMLVESIQFEESKTVTEQRLAARMATQA